MWVTNSNRIESIFCSNRPAVVSLCADYVIGMITWPRQPSDIDAIWLMACVAANIKEQLSACGLYSEYNENRFLLFCHLPSKPAPACIDPSVDLSRSSIIRVTLCLFVCLSVCLSSRISQKSHVQISPNFRYIFSVAVVRSSSDGNAIRYVLPVFWIRHIST